MLATPAKIRTEHAAAVASVVSFPGETARLEDEEAILSEAEDDTGKFLPRSFLG